MPADRLARTIRRLRRDARRAPCEGPREHDLADADEDRWQRFRAAVDTCEELLDLIESPHRTEGEEGALCNGQPPTTTAYELSPVSPPDPVILAAVEPPPPRQATATAPANSDPMRGRGHRRRRSFSVHPTKPRGRRRRRGRRAAGDRAQSPGPSTPPSRPGRRRSRRCARHRALTRSRRPRATRRPATCAPGRCGAGRSSGGGRWPRRHAPRRRPRGDGRTAQPSLSRPSAARAARRVVAVARSLDQEVAEQHVAGEITAQDGSETDIAASGVACLGKQGGWDRGRRLPLPAQPGEAMVDGSPDGLLQAPDVGRVAGVHWVGNPVDAGQDRLLDLGSVRLEACDDRSGTRDLHQLPGISAAPCNHRPGSSSAPSRRRCSAGARWQSHSLRGRTKGPRPSWVGGRSYSPLRSQGPLTQQPR
jgi:hypothetical protein